MPGFVEELGERGLVIRDGVLGEVAAAAARTEAEELVARGLLQPRGLSRGEGFRLDPEQRGDEALWLSPAVCGPALGRLVAGFEALEWELRSQAYLPLRRREIQLARYAGGARYVRHRDAFPGRPGRLITAIHYLTGDGWDVERDGGALLVHPPGGTVEVAPRLDRQVIFRSELEHEVLPSHRERLAVTCWFAGPEDVPP